MKGGFRELLKRFSLESTVLGLKYFYLYRDPVSRCLGTAVSIFILYMCAYIVRRLYLRFQDNPTRITIENQYADVTGLPMPSITICSPNQMTISAMKHFAATLIDGNHTIDLETTLPQLLAFYQMVHTDAGTLAHLQSLIDLNRYTLSDVISMLPQPCDRFLIACAYRKTLLPGCKGLFVPIMTTQGMCCAFNNVYHFTKRGRNERVPGFEPVKVQRTGIQSSLTVAMDFNPKDALNHTVIRAGATRVMFNDWTEFPADDESALVEPYTETFHSIHATHTYCSDDVKELPSTSRKCLFADELQLPYIHGYHNSDCDTLCLVRAVETQCDCIMPYVPNMRFSMACNATKLPCIAEARLSMQLKQTECECPRDCDYRRYNVDTLVGNLRAIKHLARNIYGDWPFERSTTVMHFFFQTQAYVKQKQETVMSIVTIAANLGGVFGLFVGCSVITVFEILFYVKTFVKNSVCARVRRRRARRVCHCPPQQHIAFFM